MDESSVERALQVNFEVATREGHPPRTAAREFGIKGLTDPASKRSGSMLHDVESGAPVEADHIIGWMLDKNNKNPIPSN